MRSSWYPPWAAATVGYVVVLFWLTWPLARFCVDHLPDPAQVIGGIGWAIVSDIHHGAWALAWCAGALLADPARLFDANILYPAPESLAYGENYLGHMPVALPVYTVSRNPVLTFNVVLLTSYLGCALAMHALVWRWTRSHAAAFAAGLVYAFNPWRLSQGFWLEYRGAMYLPLIPLLLERWSEESRWRDLGALMVCLFLQTLCSYYLGYAAFLVGGLFTGLLIARRKLSPRSVAAVASAAAITAATLALLSVPYLRNRAAARIPPVDFSLAQLGAFQPQLAAPGSAWFPGWTVLVLCALGIMSRPSHRGARLASVTFLAAGVLLALGPYTTMGSWRVPLPYRWFYDVVPGFDATRFPAMFLSVAVLGLAALAGLGLAALGPLARRVQRRLPAAVILLGAVPVLLAYEAGSVARMAVRPLPVGGALPDVYRALAAAPEDGVLLELPLGGGGDLRGFYREAYYMVLSTYHRKRMVNGYTAYVPPTHGFLAAIGRRLPDPEALADLVDLINLRWIVVHGMRSRRPWNTLERSGSVRRIATAGDDVLFEVHLPRRQNLLPALRAAVTEVPETTLTGTPLSRLPSAALRADWRFSPLPESVLPRRSLRLRLMLRNTGPAVWPGWGVRPDGLVVAELRWLKSTIATAPAAPPTILRLPRDVRPGQSVTLEKYLKAPAEAGAYLLEARLRQAGSEHWDDSEDVVGASHRMQVSVRAPD
jgi:hypothetical protein